MKILKAKKKAFINKKDVIMSIKKLYFLDRFIVINFFI